MCFSGSQQDRQKLILALDVKWDTGRGGQTRDWEEFKGRGPAFSFHLLPSPFLPPGPGPPPARSRLQLLRGADSWAPDTAPGPFAQLWALRFLQDGGQAPCSCWNGQRRKVEVVSFLLCTSLVLLKQLPVFRYSGVCHVGVFDSGALRLCGVLSSHVSHSPFLCTVLPLHCDVQWLQPFE